MLQFKISRFSNGVLLCTLITLLCTLNPTNSYATKDYNWDGEAGSDDWELGANWDSGNTAPGTSNDPGTYAVENDNFIANITAATFAGPGNTNTYGINELGIIGSATVNITGDKLTVTSNNGIVSPRSGGTLNVNGGDIEATNMFVLDGGSSLTITDGTVDISATVGIGRDPNNPTGNNSFGTPTITVGMDGVLNCQDLEFDNEEAETPTLIIQENGIVNVNGNLFTSNSRSSGNVQITISGNGQLNIDGNLTLTDDWTGSDHTISMDGGTINIKGNFTNEGANSITGGTITFNGIGAQEIISTTSASGGTFYNLDIQNAVGLTLSSDINVTGDFTSTAAVNLTAGTVTFNGNAGQQTVSGTGIFTFLDLVLDNSDGLVLSNATIIAANGSADFQDGVVTLGSTLTFLDEATTTSTAASYVNGSVIKTGDNDFTFPLSSQISISGVSGVETFTAQYSAANGIPIYGSDRADGIDHVSSLEHWVLDRAGGASATVTLQWNAGSDVGPDQAAWDKLLLCRWDGSEWVSHGGGGSGTVSSGTVSGSVSDFSPFTFGSTDKTNALPVEFLYFEASIYNEVVELDWATATETDNDKFEVERSVDGVTFEKIGEIVGNGDSNKKIDYAFDDINFSEVFSEDVYYRLKQIDYDGEFEYSETARVYRPLEKKTLEVVPNPYATSFELQFVATQDEKVAVRVLDMNGKIYYSTRHEASKGTNSFEISDLYNIPTGLYLVNIQGSSISFTERILKK